MKKEILLLFLLLVGMPTAQNKGRKNNPSCSNNCLYFSFIFQQAANLAATGAAAAAGVATAGAAAVAAAVAVVVAAVAVLEVLLK